MNSIKGFTFYKSYYESLKDLKEKDKKDIINAMLEYVFEDKIPNFNGVKKIIWALIQPNLNSSKNRSNANSGAPLGNQNASKEKQSKNNQNSINDLKDKDKDKDKDKERERDNIYPTNAPTLSELRSFCQKNDMEEFDCEYFYDYYEANGWVNGNGSKIKNWQAKVKKWYKDDIKSGKIRQKVKEEIDTRKIREDENGKYYQLNSDGTRYYI